MVRSRNVSKSTITGYGWRGNGLLVSREAAAPSAQIAFPTTVSIVSSV
jgi:hypothetical protein